MDLTEFTSIVIVFIGSLIQKEKKTRRYTRHMHCNHETKTEQGVSDDKITGQKILQRL